MNRVSRFLALGAVAGLGLSLGLLAAQDGRADVSRPALALAYTAGDIDHAHGAFAAFRNRLDQAPRPGDGRVAAIQGERDACSRHAWPHIPQSCQNSASGRPARTIRLVAVDLPAR